MIWLKEFNFMFLKEWQRRRREEDHLQKQESEERKKKLHKKIEEWRSQIIAKDEAKRRVILVSVRS